MVFYRESISFRGLTIGCRSYGCDSLHSLHPLPLRRASASPSPVPFPIAWEWRRPHQDGPASCRPSSSHSRPDSASWQVSRSWKLSVKISDPPGRGDSSSWRFACGPRQAGQHCTWYPYQVGLPTFTNQKIGHIHTTSAILLVIISGHISGFRCWPISTMMICQKSCSLMVKNHHLWLLT